jgi:hypothetical protein
MTKNNLFNLYTTLKAINVKGVKFNYAVAKNINLIEPEVKAFQKAGAPSPEFTAYEKERVELAKSHAKKDEKGRPLSKDNRYDIENQELFDTEFEALKETHKDAIDARNKQVEELNAILEEETKLDLFKVKQEDLSEELTTQQLTGIMDIVE